MPIKHNPISSKANSRLTVTFWYSTNRCPPTVMGVYKYHTEPNTGYTPDLTIKKN